MGDYWTSPLNTLPLIAAKVDQLVGAGSDDLAIFTEMADYMPGSNG
jgi:hypothetical protein